MLALFVGEFPTNYCTDAADEANVDESMSINAMTSVDEAVSQSNDNQTTTATTSCDEPKAIVESKDDVSVDNDGNNSIDNDGDNSIDNDVFDAPPSQPPPTMDDL